jgi:hypothetical protein
MLGSRVGDDFVPSGRISEGSSSKRFTSGRILHATTRRAGNRVYTFAGSRCVLAFDRTLGTTTVSKSIFTGESEGSST